MTWHPRRDLRGGEDRGDGEEGAVRGRRSGAGGGEEGARKGAAAGGGGGARGDGSAREGGGKGGSARVGEAGSEVEHVHLLLRHWGKPARNGCR